LQQGRGIEGEEQEGKRRPSFNTRPREKRKKRRERGEVLIPYLRREEKNTIKRKEFEGERKKKRW